MPDSVTILHLSDMQFGKNHLFGRLQVPFPDKEFDSLAHRIIEDLDGLQDSENLQPDLIVVSGDLAEWGLPGEFDNARRFLETVADHLHVSRANVVIVPGNHDVNRRACEAHFAECASDGVPPTEPFRAKWKHFEAMFRAFYHDLDAHVRPEFSLNEPWSLYQFEAQRIVIAALNSTIAEIHDIRPEDPPGVANPEYAQYIESGKYGHFGYVGEAQARWFERQLKSFEQGWLRIGVVHHNLRRGAVDDDEHLRDVDLLNRVLDGHIDLWLHGHTHEGKKDHLPNGTLILSTGSTALAQQARPDEVACQYQYFRVEADAVRQWTRKYDLGQGRWIADPRCSRDGNDWRVTHEVNLAERMAGPGQSLAPAATPTDPAPYLRRLMEQCAKIQIRGLEVGSGKATNLPIDELYIPLLTSGTGDGRHERKGKDGILQEEHEGHGAEDLRAALRHKTLVVVGDPGSGKSTFLRRIAFHLCQQQLGDSTATGDPRWESVGHWFPVHISLARLAAHIESCGRRDEGFIQDDAARWLAHHAATECAENAVPLDAAFFERQLESAKTLVLLDGLDEPPDEARRVSLRKLIEGAASAYPCRFLVSTRPATYSGEVVLEGFEEARIAPLDDETIEDFLHKWCHALWRENAHEAEAHRQQLESPIRERTDIRRLARNPVMLTALAIVHWNETRLPEQRAELYESIVKWLSRSRQGRPDRPSPEDCVALIQELALAMVDHPDGRQTQIARRDGAEAIATSFRQFDQKERTTRAERFLQQEEIDSGIIVGRGLQEIRFWHLTFQEYLAARALAADDERRRQLFADRKKLFQPEWKEVWLLLAGVLRQQGVKRVDAMFTAILDDMPKNASLADQARTFGLLGAAVQDLAPNNYKPNDVRYQQMATAVLGIFDANSARPVDMADAIGAAEALGEVGDPRFLDLTSQDLWVTIPAGEFLMGSQSDDSDRPNYDPQAYFDESPPHRVRHAAYRIGRYPVTVAEYKRFVEAGGYAKQNHWKAGGFGQWDRPNYWEEQGGHPNRPVTGVCWWEAMAYASWAGCRLPSEAEWERAARDVEARRYPWGRVDMDEKRGNYQNNVGVPTPVGVYPNGATRDGITDLAGNVWEWCEDKWHDNYAGAPTDGSAWTMGDEEDVRVLRGGSWISDALYCRSAYRYWYGPGSRNSNFGFRVASGTS